MSMRALQDSQKVVYTCESGKCSWTEIADTAFEADKPNGFFIELRKITGSHYRHHSKTPAPVYFCSKECLLEGLQFGISHMVEPTVPIGIDPRKRSNR